ncbi:MAG TPA: alpha/beta hydrolase fold domain-containing protein [Candidatus Faecousia excrementipullorum]|nr:alpha/beta hydrolase fold domain-containing protein [Candidatus Faecousia excrementipullorum]
MALSAKYVRSRLTMLRSVMKNFSLESSRKGQRMLGELMEFKHRKMVIIKDHPFEKFAAAWVIPKDERRQGVILYLHGGGYACGDLEYAKGYGSTLAVRCGIRVFSPAYRLAPESPFPAALEDALESYRYLLKKGYDPRQIALCGESAGGGLIYALCLKLKEENLPLPGGLIAMSPWTDLTSSGESYETNRDVDPNMTVEQLQFYTRCYTTDPKNPLASPIFGNLEGLPPSLIFVGGDEIMLSDAADMHKNLLAAGCKSRLVVAPERWHAYVLYELAENEEDYDTINHFLSQYISEENKLRWMPLDNAAKIYPAARSHNWTNAFRLSATLKEEVDTKVLQSALDVTIRRFPSLGTRLRKGLFWYYLQQVSHAPAIRQEMSYPLTRMTRKDLRDCALRVIVYHNRIAVEFFHSLTDGNGGVIFLKALVAEYLQQKYHLVIPAEQGVVGRLEEPSPEELEDSFLKYAGPVSASRRENNAWHLKGTPEPDGFLNVTCFQLPVAQVLEQAHHYCVSMTTFLSAALMQAILNLQAQQIPNRRYRKYVRLLIPVNLRRLFPSKSMRNFALYTTPEVDPKLGDYSFEELCQIIQHRIALDVTPKQMSARIATNVKSEQVFLLKITPLFIKNLVMKAVFLAVGERKSCLCLSNLGQVTLPKEMESYVERLDFILSSQAMSPHNCGVLSYKDTLYVNFTRNIVEPNLEREFFLVLREMGLPVEVQSNHSPK